MTGTSTPKPPHVERFQQLLREMFQFDCADLDFGIYRIMNQKRDAIEKFITEQLPDAVAVELDRGSLFQQSQANAAMEQAAQRVRDALGPLAIGTSGEVTSAFPDAPVVQTYLQAREQAGNSDVSRAATEGQIYNHLYAFFNRYYQDGDFISKRRYSRAQRYAIPYNGEEVYLHWANSDQYYIKTAEHFHDYDWKAPNGVTVRFKLQAANVEQNNVKGEQRFFLPLVSETQWEEDSGEVVIPFEYRPLTPPEAMKHGNQRQQDKIIAATINDLSTLLGQLPAALNTALTSQQSHNGNGPVSYLEHHLRQYTRRNTSDFFIHKDLKGFLSRELDFYLKNEVLSLDEMEHAGKEMAEGWFQILRLVKSVGNSIIDFLAQIEDFQKMLWEKRKFVTETHYCITLGNISVDFYPDIVNNDAQWEEWTEILGVDGNDRSEAPLHMHPTLVVDTKHFEDEFTDRLLASFGDLDAMTDGLMVHGENWQAIRILDERYRQSVKCIYIDPPYNAPSSEIIYKNGYKHSTYLSLIHARVHLSRSLMADNAVHILAIDENEYERTCLMLRSILGDLKHTTVSIVHNPAGQQGQNFSPSHDYACFSYRDAGRQIGYEVRGTSSTVSNFRDWGGEESRREAARNCFYPIFLKGGQITGFGDVCAPDYHPGSINVSVADGAIAVYPVDSNGIERKWRFARSTVEGIVGELLPHFVKSRKEWDIQRRKNTFNFKTVWADSRYFGNNHGTQLLNHILGAQLFDYPKSINTVMDCLRAGLNGETQCTVLDYFEGSGTTAHAVINLNREDGGQRKFIIVEMGEYFDTVLLPRIKKVTFAPDWKTGEPRRMATTEEAERSPRIVKCIRLESYEDALNSIEFNAAPGQMALEEKFDDYLLKYMLRWETKGSETLLNVEKLTSPFSYQLRLHVDGETRVQNIDVPETFNYLLGLNVRSRRVYEDDVRRYLVYRGETRDSPGRNVAVIWRDAGGWQQHDLERDEWFVQDKALAAGADQVYVNGDSLIPEARSVERLFRERMFAGT